MRRRSGALHCETQQQMLELASNNQIGLYYDEGPRFRDLKFQHQWTIQKAQSQPGQAYRNFEFNQQEQEAKQQEKQLNRGTRYLQNCIVDKQTIRCSIQICIIAQNLEQVISKIVNKDSLLKLFIHNKETTDNCIYKHSTITSFPNSNVLCLETSNVDCCKHLIEKENISITPKNWLKQNKNDKMMELLILKKVISIRQDTQLDTKRIHLIHRIFIVNQKHLQNLLVKIYLKKCHYVIDAREQTLKTQNVLENKSSVLYNKIFNKSILDRECFIYDRGQFGSSHFVQGEQSKFHFVFHKLEQKIAKTYMRRLKDILIEQKRQPNLSQKVRK